MQIIGILAGVVSGFIWEKLSTTPFENHFTLVQSLVIKGSKGSFHVHHWIAYVLILLAIIIVSIKTNRLFHPAVLMMLSFLISALTYYVWKYTNLHMLLK